MPKTSITAKPGRDFALKAADPDVSPSVYATVGGARATNMTINNNPVDITNVASNGFREWLPDGGIQDFAVTLDGILDSLTTGAQSLEKAARNRQLIDVQLTSGHGDSFFFAAVVNTFTRSGPFDDAEGFNAALTSHGTITYVPAS